MSPLKPNPYLAKLLVCADAVLAVELINTSAGSCSLLLSCVERMALGANLHVDVLLCRTCYELVATVANYLCLVVIWMDSFSHFIHLSDIICGFRPRPVCQSASVHCRQPAGAVTRTHRYQHLLSYTHPSRKVLTHANAKTACLRA